MALTQEQVDWWFSQNPDATAEEVAEAVKSVGGLEGNEGLAGMIANRYAISEPEVTNYYNAYTAPKVDTPVKQDTQTFTNIIDSGADTTENDFLTTLAAPADNINANNGYVKPSARPTSGAVSNVIEGDDIDTQIDQLPTEYASWQTSSVPGYIDLIRKDDGAILDRRKNATFSDADLIKMGLSFIPGMAPIVAGYNAIDAARRGDWTGAAIGATGLIPGMQNVNTALRVGQAIDQNNPFGAVTALAGNTDLQKFVGLDTANIGGFTAKDATAAANLTKAAIDGNYGSVLTNLGTLANSPDTKIAGQAVTLLTRFNNGDPKALFDAVNLSNSISNNKTTGATNTALQLAGIDTDTVSDAGNGFTIQGDDGSSLNFPDFTGSDSINADADLFNSSIGDLDATGNITDTTGLDMGDVIPDGSDGVEELVVTGTGDKTDTTTDTDADVEDKGTTIITGKRESCPVGTVLNPITGECDPVTDEGETVITGKRESCPVGTVLNPITGECDPFWDEGGGDVCDIGFHQDPETGMCVPDETEKETITCPPGKVPNEAGTACIDEVVITDKKDFCPVGTVLNPVTGDCDPIEDDECAPGFHRDEATGLCVPDDDDECKTGYEKVNGVCVPVCKEGYIRNLETGVCEKVDDKSCPPGQVKNAEGKCVPITKTTECQPGYERVNGVCVPVCQPGYQRVNGVCKKIATDLIPTPTTSALGAEGEKTDPIYAGGMDEFNLFATLEELLKENSDKTDKKKDSKKSKDKTKMATGGHLDDLLAEQMTVDDLLKLLR